MADVLESVLAKLLVPQTSIVKQATVELKSLFKKPEVVSDLCCVLRSSSSREIRSYAAVLLRRKLERRRKWFLLPPNVRSGLKYNVILSLQEEPEKSVKYVIAQLVGTLAKHELPKNTWPELLQFLQTAVSSDELVAREIGIFALSIVAFNAAEQLQPHLAGLLSLFRKTLQDANVTIVPFYTIKTLTSLSCVMGSEEMHEFQLLIPKILQVICQLVLQDEEKSCETFELFDALVESEISFITPHIKSLIDLCLEIAVNNELGDDLKVRALTVVSRLVRLKTKAILKHHFVQPILKAVLTVMYTAGKNLNDDENETDESEPFDGVESNTPLSVAAQVIDLMALHLPPEKLMNPLMTFIEPALTSEDLQHRKAAYIAFAVTAEGCSDYIQRRYLKFYLESVCKGIQDRHASVSSAALFALGQFSEHLQPEVSKYAADVFPLLFAALGNVCQQLRNGQPQPPFCVKIFYALENFCESLGDDIVAYLPVIMEHLFNSLGCSSSVSMQELAIGAIGATAGSAGSAIMPYFDEIMSRIKLFLTLDHTEEILSLQIQSLNTLSVLVRCVGSDMVCSFCPECIQLGMSLIETVDDAYLRRCTYGLFASISTILKEEMACYLPIILQPMIKTLQYADGYLLNAADNDSNPLAIFDDLSDDDPTCEEDIGDEDEDDEDDDDDVGYNIENAFIEEKEDTCSALQEIASNTKVSFLPFIENVSVQTSQLMDHPAPNIRKAAIEALGVFCIVVYEAAKYSPEDQKKTALKIASTLLSKLVVIVREDRERMVAMGSLGVIKSLVDSLQHELFANCSYLQSVVAVIKDVMQGKVACQDQVDVNDELDIEEDDHAELDALLIESAADILPSLAKSLPGPEFSPYFAGVLSILVNKMKKSSSTAERSYAVGTLAECAAAMQDGIIPFVVHILPLFISAAQDRDNEVRSNAIFGLGVLAEHGHDTIYSHFPSLLQLLSGVLSVENDPRARDNICGAVCRMVLANLQAVPLDQIFSVLLQNLPLRVDFEENTTILRCFSYLFSLKYSQVLNHMPKIIEILATISHTDQVNSDAQVLLDNLIIDIRCNFPTEFDAIMMSLNNVLAAKLASTVSSSG